MSGLARVLTALHGCEFRHVEDVTPDGQPIGPLCGAPARLYRVNGVVDRWVCDEHAELLEREEARPLR